MTQRRKEILAVLMVLLAVLFCVGLSVYDSHHDKRKVQAPKDWEPPDIPVPGE